MALRHSCLCVKEIVFGTLQQFLAMSSVKICTKKLQFSTLKKYSKTLSTSCWHGYNRDKTVLDAGSHSPTRFEQTFHREQENLSGNVVCYQKKHWITQTADKLLDPTRCFSNSIQRNLFLSAFKCSHSNFWLPVNKCVSRKFSSCVSESANTTRLQALSQTLQINCLRMKHSKPKVPPTRMMRLYDFERLIPDEEAAKEFVFALNTNERKCLYDELARYHGDDASSAANDVPTKQQLKQVALHQALPFIGFGFLDNFLMIVAGEYIDVTLGATLGISTMAAAALGNMFSDIGGLGSAHYVERFASKVGVKNPHLSPAQVDMKTTKWASNFGKVIGVAIGCFLGMFPLLFFKDKENEHEDKEENGKDSKS